MWQGRSRDGYTYSIDHIPGGGYAVYRHLGVQYAGSFEKLEDAEDHVRIE